MPKVEGCCCIKREFSRSPYYDHKSLQLCTQARCWNSRSSSQCSSSSMTSRQIAFGNGGSCRLHDSGRQRHPFVGNVTFSSISESLIFGESGGVENIFSQAGMM